MLVSRLFRNAKSAVAGISRDWDWMSLWETYILPQGLPLLLGLGMGALLALFIVGEAWPFVIGLLLLIPATVLFNTYPFVALLIWISMMPFLQTTVNSAYRHTYWIIHRAMPPVALGVVVLAGLLKVTKRPPVRLGRAELAMVAFLGLAMVNIFWFQSSPLSYLYSLCDTVFVPLCLYWLVRLVGPRERELRQLLPIAFVIVVVESVVCILSWLAPEVLPPEWKGAVGARGIGTLGYPHVYTTTLVFSAFLLFQAAMSRKPGVIRSVLLLTWGLGAVGVFFSFSRGSWLGGLAAIAGLLVMYPKTTARIAVVVLILMIILGSTVLSTQIAYATERMNSESTAKDRWVIWDAGLRMIQAKPFFGWGYGNYKFYAEQFQRRVHNHVVRYGHASHNSYIATAGELGLPALFLFALPVLWWLKLTLKVWPRIPNKGFWSRSLLFVFWMVILDHVVATSFSDMRHSTYGMGMWWITLGLIANMVNAYLQPDDVESPGWTRRAIQI